MKNFINKNKIYFINIVAIIAIFIMVLLLNKISPFGNNILGKSDAINQFKPMLFDFITKIKTGSLLNYSFNNGLGTPFIFTYIYYLASPLNLIALLFKTVDGMYLSTLLIKLLVGSLTITYYAKNKTNNNYIIFIAAISYIFSSWFLAYYYNSMWLDIFVLLPLYQKGLEDLLNKKKPSIYIFSLALITISNIHLAIPVYLYTIIYFIIYALIYKKGTAKEKVLTFDVFALSTIVTFLITAFFLSIAFDVFLKSGINPNNDISSYTINFFNFIKSLFYGNTNTIASETKLFPNIAFNTFILINCLYFFINKNISKKDKIFSLIGIALIICTIFIKYINYAFNSFQGDTINFSYTFIISILTIKMFIANITSMEIKDYKKLLFTIPIIFILLLLSFKKQEFNTLIFNISFIVCYLIILWLYQNNKIYKLLLCLLIVLQSLIALKINIGEDKTKEEINYSLYQKENVKYRLNIPDNDLEKSFNYNLYYNSKVTHQLSSITYNNINNLAANLGNFTVPNKAILMDDHNLLSSLIFNVKQDYYLEKIFAVNSLSKLVDSGMDTTIKENTENIIYSMTGIKDIYDKEIVKGTLEDGKYHFETNHDYFLLEEEGEDKSLYTTAINRNTFSLSEEYGKEEAVIYVLNKNKLKDIYNYLKKNQIKYSYYNDNKIEGTINVDKNQIIYTSIPYDESWEITIDNEITKPTRLFDSLIGIEVKPGKHTIKMEYKNNYTISIIISTISLLGFIIFNIKRKN